MSAAREIAILTWRLLLGDRRWLALVACNALPVLVAWLFVANRATSDLGTAATFLSGLVDAVVVTGLLPLAAVVFGTTAFGREIEDGTVTYLLAKPTPRWLLVVAKLGSASAATAVAVLPGVMVAGWVLVGSPIHPIVQGFTVGISLGALLYSALFLTLGLYTRRALVLGLVYVLAWEGVLSRAFAGTRSLSVREYTSVLSDAVASRSMEAVGASLPPPSAVWMSVVVLALAVFLAIRTLRGLEVTERG